MAFNVAELALKASPNTTNLELLDDAGLPVGKPVPARLLRFAGSDEQGGSVKDFTATIASNFDGQLAEGSTVRILNKTYTIETMYFSQDIVANSFYVLSLGIKR